MIGALAFLTILGRGRRPDASHQPWFPFVGAAIGALVGLVWWGASQWWPPLVAGALAVVADLVITGLLHLDGLADSADGLLPHMDRARRLAVMSAPDTGAFAVATVAAVLLLRWAALGANTLDGSHIVAACAGLWALSRGVMVVAMNVLPYARAEVGLGSAFAGSRSAARTTLLCLLGGSLGVTGLILGRGALHGVITAVAALVAGVGVLALGRRRLGGYTGDVLGAAGVMCETVGLLVLCASTR